MSATFSHFLTAREQAKTELINEIEIMFALKASKPWLSFASLSIAAVD